MLWIIMPPDCIWRCEKIYRKLVQKLKVKELYFYWTSSSNGYWSPSYKRRWPLLRGSIYYYFIISVHLKHGMIMWMAYGGRDLIKRGLLYCIYHEMLTDNHNWEDHRGHDRMNDSWIHNYLCIQCLSPLRLWVLIPLMTRCTRYNTI
jgi:hypothetical protein